MKVLTGLVRIEHEPVFYTMGGSKGFDITGLHRILELGKDFEAFRLHTLNEKPSRPPYFGPPHSLPARSLLATC